MLENRYLYSSFVDAYGREVLARYFFESEFINIPGTDMSLEVDAEHWATCENDNLALYHHEQFTEVFQPLDKMASNYLNFVIIFKTNIFDNLCKFVGIKICKRHSYRIDKRVNINQK